MYSYSFCYSVRPLLQHFKSKQIAYRKRIHGFLTGNARIIIRKFKGKDSYLHINKNNREKRGIISITTGLAALAYKGINVYLNWKNKAMEKGNKTKQSHQNEHKNELYQVNQELVSYWSYELTPLQKVEKQF